MDILGGIEIGQWLGKRANHFVMNYGKQYYEDKISELESCKAELEKHLSILEGYRNEVDTFLTGDQSDSFKQKCDNQIKIIRNKYDLVEQLIGSCKTAIEVQDESEKKIDTNLEKLDLAQKVIDLFEE